MIYQKSYTIKPNSNRMKVDIVDIKAKKGKKFVVRKYSW